MKSSLFYHWSGLGKILDRNLAQHDRTLLIGDWNLETTEKHMEHFCHIYHSQYHSKNPNKPAYTDLFLKVHYCRFENLLICLCSYKNNTLKIARSSFYAYSSYLPVKFVNFLKSRLIFNILYCFWTFVNKLVMYLTCAYLKT